MRLDPEQVIAEFVIDVVVPPFRCCTGSTRGTDLRTRPGTTPEWTRSSINGLPPEAR